MDTDLVDMGVDTTVYQKLSKMLFYCFSKKLKQLRHIYITLVDTCAKF
jgi:hypothetical protein